jgi:hypothetical protein
MTDGKLYQTVRLSAGTYRFSAYCNGSYVEQPTMYPPYVLYVVAAQGISDGLPNTGDVESSPNVLDFVTVPFQVENNTVHTVNFEINESTDVSLGFVATLYDMHQVYFTKVELLQYK